MSRRHWIGAVVVTTAAVIGAPRLLSGAPRRASSLTVYKDADCSCCEPWVEHVRGAGQEVKVVEEPSYAALQKRKDELQVPSKLRSCHTGVLTVSGSGRARSYLIEGHVPADAIARLVAEQPDVLGLAVPGMPSGTPGMEWPSSKTEVGEYDVLAFSHGDVTHTFGRYPGRRRSAKS
jgi:hypothetical protein